MIIGIILNKNKMKILAMNSITFKITVQQDYNTGNKFYYILRSYFDNSQYCNNFIQQQSK